MNAPTSLYYSREDPLLRLVWHEPLPGVAVPEVVVQEIWRVQRLHSGALRTTGGVPVQIFSPGTLNLDGGPDFRNARLRIGETVWFGDVEIHTTSRGWVDHGHHHDPRYDRVVLHVVLQPDLWTGSLVRSDGTSLPELVLAPHLDGHLRDRLIQFFVHPPDARPCAWGLAGVPPPVMEAWLRACAAQRLERRARAYTTAEDASQLLYENVASALGYRPNAEPMRRLAQRVSHRDLATLRSPRDREALLFGMAGLLPAADGCAVIEGAETRARIEDLRRRFEVLQPRDHAPLHAAEWQYARLRPANFPEIRIAQLASLIRPGGPVVAGSGELLSEMLMSGARLSDLDAVLEATPDEFWKVHYRFARPSPPHATHIGQQTRHRILANVLLPAAVAALSVADRAVGIGRALAIYEQMPPEDDHLVRGFSPALKPPSLLHTQGLHELDESYCIPQQCLGCDIGQQLLLGRGSEPSSLLQPAAPCSSESST